MCNVGNGVRCGVSGAGSTARSLSVPSWVSSAAERNIKSAQEAHEKPLWTRELRTGTRVGCISRSAHREEKTAATWGSCFSAGWNSWYIGGVSRGVFWIRSLAQGLMMVALPRFGECCNPVPVPGSLRIRAVPCHPGTMSLQYAPRRGRLQASAALPPAARQCALFLPVHI